MPPCHCDVASRVHNDYKLLNFEFKLEHRCLQSLVQISMAISMLVTNLVVINVQNAKEDRQVCNLLFLFCSSTNWEIVVAHMPIMFPLAKFFRDIKLDANQISKSRNTKLPENVSYRLCLKQARSRTEQKAKQLNLNIKSVGLITRS